jgi:hypothetical protein
MASQHLKRAVGVFSTRPEAEQALRELQHSGFSMNQISIIAQDADRQGEIAGVEVQDGRGNKADEGAATGAMAGGALGGLTGLLVGLGTLAIPGVGPIVLAGEVATALATTLAGGAIGAAAGSLAGALIGLGIPEERAKVYSDRVAQGQYLVIVDGSEAEITKAQSILANRGIQEWGVYDPQPVSTTIGTPASVSSSAAATPVLSTDYATAPMTSTDYAVSPVDRPLSSSTMTQKRAIGVFPNRQTAESALYELRNAGVSMDMISVIAKDADSHKPIAGADVKTGTGNKADEGAVTGAVTGGAAGGIGGLLVGLGALAIPGIGPVMLAGATATALATTLSGTAIGAAAGSLVGALIGLGIPEERAHFYNDRISRGDYLIVVDGREDDIRTAEAILRRQGIQDWDIFDAPDQTRSGEHNREGLTSTRNPSATRNAEVTGAAPDVVIIDRREETR